MATHITHCITSLTDPVLKLLNVQIPDFTLSPKDAGPEKGWIPGPAACGCPPPGNSRASQSSRCHRRYRRGGPSTSSRRAPARIDVKSKAESRTRTMYSRVRVLRPFLTVMTA